jgi:hypothetical protein
MTNRQGAAGAREALARMKIFLIVGATLGSLGKRSSVTLRLVIDWVVHCSIINNSI